MSWCLLMPRLSCVCQSIYQYKLQKWIISQWNLEKKELLQTEIPFHFDQRNCSSQIPVFYFRESSILCHCEQKDSKNFALSYFKLPLINSQVPFHQFVYDLDSSVFDLSEENYNLTPIKINERSMVAFILSHSQLDPNKIPFVVYNLDEDTNKGRLNFMELDVSLNPKRHEFLHGKIKDMWEVMPQVLYVQVETYFEITHDNRDSVFDQKQERYHTFYYNMKEYRTRIGKVNIAEPHRLQFINSIRPLKYLQQRRSIGERIKDHKSFDGRVRVPIYYIEPHREELICWTPAFENGRLTWPEIQNDGMFKVVKKNQKGQQSEIQVIKYPDGWLMYLEGLKIAMAFLMTEVLGNCNDDLLDLVCQLLD